MLEIRWFLVSLEKPLVLQDVRSLQTFLCGCARCKSWSSKYIAEDSLGPLRSPLRSQEEGMNKSKHGNKERAPRNRGKFLPPDVASRLPLGTSDCTERDNGADMHAGYQNESRGPRKRGNHQSSSPGQRAAGFRENRGGGSRPRRYLSRQSSDPGQQESRGTRSVRQRLGSPTVSTENVDGDTSHQQQTEGGQKQGVLTEIQLARRQKDIDYGKNTLGYKTYREKVPDTQRASFHPKTPNKCEPCSRRYWDNKVRRWRKALHTWDPADVDDAASDKNSQAGASVSSPPSSVLSTSPTSSTLETASDTGYETIQDCSQPQEEEEEMQDDEVTLKFRTGKVKTWEEMMLEEEDKEEDDLGDADEFCLDDTLENGTCLDL
ncbi:hypothetical protein BaRGS_00000256 [Batillaria attramentaria]|uniref:Histone RNA hairpin-binding protein RNA-binding domain-containing protein n=1 Tax=Batillaria attramentaria TaxID=370345 RepID=A0ABD0MAS2_9CAEN